MKKLFVLLLVFLSCNIVFGQKYTSKKDYSEGLAAVYHQGYWGFVDRNDKLVINYAFEEVKPFSNGVAQVKYQGKWIYIDKKGKVTSAPQIAQNINKPSSSSSNSSSSNSSYSSSNASSGSNKSSSSSSYNNSSSSSSSRSSSSLSSSTSSSTSSSSSLNNNSSSNKGDLSGSKSNQTDVTKQVTGTEITTFRDKTKVEKDGFRWIETSGKDMKAWNRGELRYLSGVKDINGKELIPLDDFEFIFYSNEDNEGYPPFFEVKKHNGWEGAYTIDGKEIVAPKYGRVDYDLESDVFVFREFKVDPTKLENFTKVMLDDSPWYSLGVSLNKKGEPYMSNKRIVSYSDYYTPPKTSNSYSYSSSSSSTSTAPVLNAENLSKGIVVVAAGAAIIAGISKLLGNSSSSSSSSNSSNNRSSSSGSSGSYNNSSSSSSGNVLSMKKVYITHTELYEHNALTSKYDNCIMYMRNDNNYDVFVEVEMKVNDTWKHCFITYDNSAKTEPFNGSRSDNGSRKIHLKANSSRVVEVTSNSFRRPDGLRITNVY